MTGGIKTSVSYQPFWTPDCLFFASRLFSLERVSELCMETLPRDVFLCFAGFIWADLQGIRRETGDFLLEKPQGLEICVFIVQGI